MSPRRLSNADERFFLNGSGPPDDRPDSSGIQSGNRAWTRSWPRYARSSPRTLRRWSPPRPPLRKTILGVARRTTMCSSCGSGRRREPSPFAPPEDHAQTQAAAAPADLSTRSHAEAHPADGGACRAGDACARGPHSSPPHFEFSRIRGPSAEVLSAEATGPDPVETRIHGGPEPDGGGVCCTRGREPETAAVVAASFERLSFVVENTPPPPPVPISTGGATLEDITRDILTPVIQGLVGREPARHRPAPASMKRLSGSPAAEYAEGRAFPALPWHVLDPLFRRASSRPGEP